jgi:L,D-transpeptidase ErfK/SrfK
MIGARCTAYPPFDGSKVKAQYIKSTRLLIAFLLLFATVTVAATWNEAEFEHSPFFGFPVPSGRNAVIGNLMTYKIKKGDTLLDVGRWYGLSAKEISEANGNIDWWTPPVGRTIILPTEHILPAAPRNGIVLNIPEMRLYYYYPSVIRWRRKGAHLHPASYKGSTAARVVYTFPVGLGRFDWKTPVGAFTVTAKVKNPTWVVPEDIYREHLERDGEAEHMIPGGDPDNPLGHYKLDLSIPMYGIHGTNVPWGVGMEVSHGCIRLYPEDIERLFGMVKVGTPGDIVYEPIKFGWRGDALYVEVHDDLYGRYPGLWNHAQHLVERENLGDYVDMSKLEKAVEEKTGVPTFVMPGPEPGAPVSPNSGAEEPTVASDPND